MYSQIEGMMTAEAAADALVFHAQNIADAIKRQDNAVFEHRATSIRAILALLEQYAEQDSTINSPAAQPPSKAMGEYQIEVLVPAIDNLEQYLLNAFQDATGGSFVMIPQEGMMKIVFYRDYVDDAPLIEKKMAEGLSMHRAVCTQLAGELGDTHPEALAQVISAIQGDTATVRGLT